MWLRGATRLPAMQTSSGLGTLKYPSGSILKTALGFRISALHVPYLRAVAEALWVWTSQSIAANWELWALEHKLKLTVRVCRLSIPWLPISSDSTGFHNSLRTTQKAPWAMPIWSTITGSSIFKLSMMLWVGSIQTSSGAASELHFGWANWYWRVTLPISLCLAN